MRLEHFLNGTQFDPVFHTFPPNEIRWIFDKVYEVGDIMHHSSGRFGFGSKGFGLGLALCKAIIEAHRGRIEVQSTPGRGSRFIVILSGDKTRQEADTMTADEKRGVLV